MVKGIKQSGEDPIVYLPSPISYICSSSGMIELSRKPDLVSVRASAAGTTGLSEPTLIKRGLV